MQIITQRHDITPYSSKRLASYWNGLSVAFFDIETTGLSPNYSKCILAGILLPYDTYVETIQLFAEKPSEEPLILEEFAKLMRDRDVFISYNGNSFDLPFLQQRYASIEHSSTFLQRCSSLDLYRVVRYYSKLREALPNLKQKSIEFYLGLSEDREDAINGAESVELYRAYTKNATKELRDKILLHNRDDIVQLSKVMRVLDQVDLHKTLYHEGFPVSYGAMRVYLSSIAFTRNSIVAKATTTGVPRDYFSFEAGWQATHLSGSSALSIEIPLETADKNMYLDLQLLPIDAAIFAKSDALKNGFLILKDESGIRYEESNTLIRAMICAILSQE